MLAVLHMQGRSAEIGVCGVEPQQLVVFVSRDGAKQSPWPSVVQHVLCFCAGMEN